MCVAQSGGEIMVYRLVLMSAVLALSSTACGASEPTAHNENSATVAAALPEPAATAVPEPAITTASEPAFTTVVTPEGVPIDVSAPGASGNLPVVILLHGAPGITKEDVAPIADMISARGVLVYNVGWTEGGMEGVDGSLVNVACAVAYARDTARTFGGDDSRMTVVGLSAGGWSGVTASLGGEELGSDCVSESSPIPDAFVGVAGAYSAAVDGPIAGLLADDPEALRASDPYTYLGENPSLGVWLIHGDADLEVPLSVSEAFRDALLAHGYAVEFVVLEGAGHPGSSVLDQESEEDLFSTIAEAAGG
jgi:acetyl esterase/lipase